jgi:hypothetical protein
MVNTGYFAKDRTNGPVFRLFLDIRTMSQGASTNIPALAGRTPRIDRIGISYMYFGAWQSKDGSSGHEFHVGPHLMIVSPHQDDFQGINRDPSNGMPYVAHLPHRTELYLVMPTRQWND